MDESSKQLVGEVHAPIPRRPGAMERSSITNTCATASPCFLWRSSHCPAGANNVEVSERRTRQDWARFIKAMLDERYLSLLQHRNNRGAPINWRFTTTDACIKLIRLYPHL
jgi:hypothetical protein